MDNMKLFENQRQADSSGRTRLVGTLMAVLLMLLLAAGNAGTAAAGGPPSPQFVSPLNGFVIEGTTAVVFYAPQHSQWSAEFGVDNADWKPMATTGNGVFSTKWNSAYVGNGWHTLTVRLSYGPGRPPVIGVSINVLVDNEMPDGQAGAQLRGLSNSTASHVCLPYVRPFSLQDPYNCGMRTA